MCQLIHLPKLTSHKGLLISPQFQVDLGFHFLQFQLKSFVVLHTDIWFAECVYFSLFVQHSHSRGHMLLIEKPLWTPDSE